MGKTNKDRHPKPAYDEDRNKNKKSPNHQIEKRINRALKIHDIDALEDLEDLE